MVLAWYTRALGLLALLTLASLFLAPKGFGIDRARGDGSQPTEDWVAWRKAHATWCRGQGVPLGALDSLDPDGGDASFPNGTRLAVWFFGRADYVDMAGVSGYPSCAEWTQREVGSPISSSTMLSSSSLHPQADPVAGSCISHCSGQRSVVPESGVPL